MSDQRPYKSPLREQQTLATHRQILEALIDTVNDVGAQDLNIRELASRACVSERTVYRHFADRTALIDGLFEHVDKHADWTSPADLNDVRDFRAAVEKGFLTYDEYERETRALVLMNLDPARTATRSREHVAMIRELVEMSFPSLSDTDAAGVSAVFNLLVSSRTWLRMLDGHGLNGVESSRFLGWVIDLIVAELEAGNTIPTDDTVG